uniref:Uncharacterized protein n=1 Tax=Plectus sambesii TaxID=2011161 RepID=A0A914VDE4_9BILA
MEDRGKGGNGKGVEDGPGRLPAATDIGNARPHRRLAPVTTVDEKLSIPL